MDMEEKIRKTLLILILILISLTSNAQTDTVKINTDSVKFEKINVELRNYGKQGFLTDKITLLEFGVVVVGAILSVPAIPLLIATTGLNLIVVAINWKADKRLSEFNVKTEHKFKLFKKQKHYEK